MTTIEQRLAPVIAHRGAAARAPENTLAAIRLAAEEGARWVEVDVKLSRDGHCILMHDELLARTTDGRGEVAHYDLDELQALDAGSWFAERHAGERHSDAGRGARALPVAGARHQSRDQALPGTGARDRDEPASRSCG